MNENWNRDVSRLKKDQEILKEKMNFKYIGHGPKCTGFMSKTFKRKPGYYLRCPSCNYYMPLTAKGTETCICGSLKRTDTEVKADYGMTEIEVFGAKQG